MKRNTVESGFSLTELLLVVALIAIFVSFILASTSGARGRGRDARRYADISQVVQALEAYYNINKSYPISDGTGTVTWQTICNNGPQSAGYSFTTTGEDGYIPNLAPTYISTLPTDPLGCAGTGDFKGYIYKSDGKDYKFASDWGAELGIECAPDKQYFDPPRGSSESHTFCSFYTHGARDW